MTKSIREQIIEEARSFLGTPFHHQGRVKHHGVDCVGLIACIGKTLGLFDYDRTNYSWQPSGILLDELEKAGFVKLPEEAEPEFGDVGVFWLTKRQVVQHIAIFTEHGMLHTFQDVGKVVEHVVDHTWRKRLAGVYRFPGVD